ncbi:MAG TPA: hypothetical protein EYM97_03110 [Gemmatimonadetes bacterium]|nr:hypothetical protein [Gemmatimonadota bacterium]
MPRGRRSQVFSAIIEKRDLNQKMRGAGILEDLGYTTVGEAILELTARLEASAKTIEQYQEAD